MTCLHIQQCNYSYLNQTLTKKTIKCLFFFLETMLIPFCYAFIVACNVTDYCVFIFVTERQPNK